MMALKPELVVGRVREPSQASAEAPVVVAVAEPVGQKAPGCYSTW